MFSKPLIYTTTDEHNAQSNYCTSKCGLDKLNLIEIRYRGNSQIEANVWYRIKLLVLLSINARKL